MVRENQDVLDAAELQPRRAEPRETVEQAVEAVFRHLPQVQIPDRLDAFRLEHALQIRNKRGDLGHAPAL